MSLESKLANLTLGDESAVVAAINADGVEKTGFASSISAIGAKLESKDDEEVLAALALVKAVAEGATDAQPFVTECLASCKYRINCVYLPSRLPLNLILFPLEKVSNWPEQRTPQ
jgi:hypothetical protein